MLNARVVVTHAAQESIRLISSDADYSSVRRVLLSLESMNEAYPVYAPQYPAASPPISCRVAHAGTYSVYYAIYDQSVVVFAIEPSRADPVTRFSHVEDANLLEQAIGDIIERKEHGRQSEE